MIQPNYSLGDFLTDDEAMDLAIHEAKKGIGRVAPNPLVGCVVLSSDHRLLSKGYHEKFGGPHAEINALKNLSRNQLKGAMVFVTLEPCAHEGKTPSCAKYLATLPLFSVTYGLQDPNPLVSGQGAEIIESAGIRTILYDHKKEELEEVCEVFLKNYREKKIFVSLKVATSLDGMLALKTGESKWITGELARLETHLLRASHDGILIGAKTLMVDNPLLDIRHPQFSDKTNKVIILDPSASCLSSKINSTSFMEKRIFQSHRPEDVILVISESIDVSLESEIKTITLLGVKIITAKMSGSSFAIEDVLEKLWPLGIRSILVEGGAYTHSKFISQNCADRLYQFIAPKIIGGKGVTWADSVEISELVQARELRSVTVRSVGTDFLISGKFIHQGVE